MRLTWLIHDMQIWRIDTVHLTGQDGIWVETVVELSGDGDVFDQPARWHRPQDEQGPDDSCSPDSDWSAPTPSRRPPHRPPSAVESRPSESATAGSAASSAPGQPLPMVLPPGSAA